MAMTSGCWWRGGAAGSSTCNHLLHCIFYALAPPCRWPTWMAMRSGCWWRARRCELLAMLERGLSHPHPLQTYARRHHI
eukprot:1144583-Pelagomonas_calceolata.AAC.1